jgi:hypothetical protein
MTTGAARIYNTASNNYSIVVCVYSLAMVFLLLRVTQPLPSSGCLPGSTVLPLRKYATVIFNYSLRK